MSLAQSRPSLPPGTFWDTKIDAAVLQVLPGDHKVIDWPTVAVTTLLGSCVAACIRDTGLGLGGLNHFLLPGNKTNEAGSARYGVNAMELLINDILKRGGRRDRLEAKVFGGGHVIEMSAADKVGDRNARFVADYLRQEGIPVRASDLGGSRARRIYFFPETGRASVLKLGTEAASELTSAEKRLQSRVEQAPRAGGLELFG
ncbi:MAG: chemoreceptor glutamine deamidase CheD [Pseudomonadota bacterium]